MASILAFTASGRELLLSEGRASESSRRDEVPSEASCSGDSGRRSQSVAERYRKRGYTNLYNLTGGIDAWSREIDPSIPRY